MHVHEAPAYAEVAVATARFYHVWACLSRTGEIPREGSSKNGLSASRERFTRVKVRKKDGVEKLTVEVVGAVKEVELRRRRAHRIGDYVRVALGHWALGKLHRRARLPKKGGGRGGEGRASVPPRAHWGLKNSMRRMPTAQ